MEFSLFQTDGLARRGELALSHGKVQTPIFMPVGSAATVKAMAPRELEEIGAEIILGNTYHLYLRPGTDIIGQFGGLHDFMGWEKPILTDSGGYQVFSLSNLNKITPEGVHFKSHIDGSACFIGPEEAMEIQAKLNSDIVMCFDECVPYPSQRDYVLNSVAMTIDWARKCKEKHSGNKNALFGIIQGGMFLDIRKNCTHGLTDIGFDGYALGGLSVGEPQEEMLSVIAETAPLMPADKPRYLMGVGTPLDIIRAVALGIDMFDCVMPTRNARNGSAFTRGGKLNIRNARFKADERPVEEGCGCWCCRNFSRAYVRHLFNAGEILGARLLSYHNIYFYINFMRDIRSSIESGTFAAFKKDFEAAYVTD